MSPRTVYQPQQPAPEPNAQLVSAYVDRYSFFKQEQKLQQKADPKREAQLFKMLFNVLADEKRLIALVDQDDGEGMEAYLAEGYTLFTMNGDRPDKLMQVVNEEAEYLEEHRPKHVVVVSGDPLFAQVCSTALTAHADVQVWLPDSHCPKSLSRFTPRSLSKLWPDILPHEITGAVWLDIENLLISLKKNLGIKVAIKEFVAAIRTATSDIGNVTHTSAYGDFRLLAGEFGQEIRNQLDELDIETHHERNMQEKNIADMNIVIDIPTRLDREPHIQTVVIGTGDRDFRPAVDAVHKRGKKVMLLAVRGSLSTELERAVDEVRYLDEYLKPNRPPVIDRNNERTERQRHEQPNRTDRPVNPNSEWTELLMRFACLLYRKRRQWSPRKELGGVATPERLQAAVEAGVLKFSRPGDPKGLTLNPDEDLVQAVQFFVPWIIGRVGHLVETKVKTGQMQYLDSYFLHKRMLDDNRCKEFGIGQKLGNAEAWLEATAKAEVLVKQRLPRFNRSGKVDTWWPVGYSEGTGTSNATSPSEPTEANSPPENESSSATQSQSSTGDQQTESRPAENEKKEKEKGTYV